MARITFLPLNQSVDVEPGTSVYEAAARIDVLIPSQCGGKCACALCRVEIVEGEGILSPIGWEEEGHLGNAFFVTRERLACQTRVYADAVIRVPEIVKKEKVGRLPNALVQKREKLDREEDLRRASDEAAGGKRSPGRKNRGHGAGQDTGRGSRSASHGRGPKPLAASATPPAQQGEAAGRDGASPKDGEAPRKRRRRRRRRKPSGGGGS